MQLQLDAPDRCRWRETLNASYKKFFHINAKSISILHEAPEWNWNCCFRVRSFQQLLYNLLSGAPCSHTVSREFYLLSTVVKNDPTLLYFKDNTSDSKKRLFVVS